LNPPPPVSHINSIVGIASGDPGRAVYQEDDMSVRDLIPWAREQRGVGMRGGEAMDPFLSLHREMNRLFDDVFRGIESRPSLFAGDGFGWPTVDVVETDKEYRVVAELPGIDEKDVELTFHDGMLILRGEKKTEHNDEGAVRSERFHGRFQRSLSLGVDVDESKLAATFKNGILTITLPKAPEVENKAKRIPIASS
jgi:HSP20 family protein